MLLAAAVFSGMACASAAPGTIGAQLGKQGDGRVFVRGVPEGEGADRAGLEVDDELLALDGRPVRGMSQDEIRKAVRGDEGSVLRVTIIRAGAVRDVDVRRSPRFTKKR